MHVLVVTNDFPPRIGGIEHYVAEVFARQPAGVTITIFASAHRDAGAFDRRFPHRVVRWPRFPMLPTRGVTNAIVALARERRPDVIVFGATFPLALMAGALRTRVGAPIVCCTHSAEAGAAKVPVGRALLRAMARHAAILTVVSAFTERQIRHAVGDAPRLERLPCGVDETRFHPAADGHRWRRDLGAGPVIVTLSRLIRCKGHDQTIRAIAALRAEFPGIRLLVGGDGRDRGRLERLGRRLGVADRVTFAGRVAYPDDVPGFLAAGDVFVMPSRAEWGGLQQDAMPSACLQAAAVGLPVVCGRAGGSAETVVEGETGHAVDGLSVPAIVSAIRGFLRAPDTARQFGRAGALRIQRDLTWTRVAARLHQLLVEVQSVS